MQKPRILVIDDASEVQELLRVVLTLKDFEVLEAYSGLDGLKVAQEQNPDLIVLDLMLPDIDGDEVCKRIKQSKDLQTIPVIMLTARSAVVDRINGLEIGANDYLIKPFDTLELLARIKVQLRQRANSQEHDRHSITLAGFYIDPATYELTINGNPIKELTPREFDILYILMRNMPNAVARSQIYEELGAAAEDSSNSRVVDIHVAKIRKKVGEQYILTIPGRGYLFAAK